VVEPLSLDDAFLEVAGATADSLGDAGPRWGGLIAGGDRGSSDLLSGGCRVDKFHRQIGVRHGQAGRTAGVAKDETLDFCGRCLCRRFWRRRREHHGTNWRGVG